VIHFSVSMQDPRLTRRRVLFAGGAALLAFPVMGQTSPALLRAARQQIGVTTGYDGRYRALAYPGGDFDRASGVCTDVIIRALRDAHGFDLQKAVHIDMSTEFEAYPPRWGLTRPDRNIDHRRVPNLETFFARAGAEIALSDRAAGDIVSMRLANGLPHIAILAAAGSDGTGAGETGPNVTGAGGDRVIHNIGAGAREERLPDGIRNRRVFRFPLADT